jgi:hypothetical protein
MPLSKGEEIEIVITAFNLRLREVLLHCLRGSDLSCEEVDTVCGWHRGHTREIVFGGLGIQLEDVVRVGLACGVRLMVVPQPLMAKGALRQKVDEDTRLLTPQETPSESPQ